MYFCIFKLLDKKIVTELLELPASSRKLERVGRLARVHAYHFKDKDQHLHFSVLLISLLEYVISERH